MATVSVSWWRAIQSTPTVWTDIGPESDEVVGLKLRKSGNLPLHIVSMPYCSPPINLLATQSNRWTSACLDLREENDIERTLQHLEVPLPRLETLNLLCTAPPNSRLELGGATILRALHLQGILPNPLAPALSTIKHLTIAGGTPVCVVDILSIMARVTDLESLVIIGLTGRRDEEHHEIEAPKLKSLTLHQPTPSSCVGLLNRLHPDGLSPLTVERTKSGADAAADIFYQLTQPNGQIRRSILSSVIANSLTETIDMVIENDSTFKMTGFKLDKEKSFHISLRDSLWQHFGTPVEFSAFGSSLPPVRLTITGTEPHGSDERPSPWSLHFLHFMPSVISITINRTGDFATRLFRDALAEEHAIGRDRDWTFPRVTEVCIGRDAQDQDWMPWMKSALHQRSEVIRDSPLSKISVWYEKDDGHWAGPIG